MSCTSLDLFVRKHIAAFEPQTYSSKIMNDLDEQKTNSDLHWHKTKDNLIFNSMKSPFAYLGAIGCGGGYFWVAWINDPSKAFLLGILGLFIGFGAGMAISILINVIRIIFIQKSDSPSEKSSKKKLIIWGCVIFGFAILNFLTN